MRSSGYLKRKDNRKRKFGAGRHFKLDVKRQISDAFSVLSSLHNLHVSWLFL